VLPGETETVLVFAPVFHAYVFAPLAVNIADDPAHTVADVAATVGRGFTVRVLVTAFVQPEEFLPVTV
jgi:hypothetical protein